VNTIWPGVDGALAPQRKLEAGKLPEPGADSGRPLPAMPVRF